MAGENACFCCFSEDDIFLCGCLCKTLQVCAGCMWTVTRHQMSSYYWESCGKECKVCMHKYSDAAVLAGCEHARRTVSAQQCGTQERDVVENDVLYTLLCFAEKELPLKLGRAIVAEYKQTLGWENMSTVLCQQNFAYVLSSFEGDVEAMVMFSECAQAQAAKVQLWNLHICSDSDRKWMYRYYVSQLNIVLCSKTIMCADPKISVREFFDSLHRQLLELMHVFRNFYIHGTHPEGISVAHEDYVFVSIALAEVLTTRVTTELHGKRARTRQQTLLVVFAREIVEQAHSGVLQVYGNSFYGMQSVINMRSAVHDIEILQL